MWQGVCMAGVMCGRGHEWQGGMLGGEGVCMAGVCIVGGLHGGGGCA